MHSASKLMTCVGAAVASPKPRAMTLRWLVLPLILLAMAPADALAQLGGLGGAVPLGGIGGIGGGIGGIGGSVGLGNTIGVPGSNGIPDAPSNSIIGPKLNIPLGSLTQPSLPNTGSVTNTLNSTTSNALALPGQITNGLGNTVNQAVRGTQAATSPRRRSGVPPAGETRFVGGEVMLRLPSNLTEQALDALARRHGLTRLESQRVGLTGTTFHRWRIDSGREVPDVIRDLEAETGVSAAQPNYRFTLAQQPQARSMGADVSNSQYALAKLHLPQAHRFATGDRVLVAVIDFGHRYHPSGNRRLCRGELRCAQFERAATSARHRHGGRDRRACPADGCRAGGAHPGDSGLRRARHRRRRHHADAAARDRLGGRAPRAHHQHELCRTIRSGNCARARRRPQKGRRAGGRLRQRRRKVAAALSGVRCQRHRSHGDRCGGQAVQAGEPRQAHRGRGAWRRDYRAVHQRGLPDLDRDIGCRRPGQRRRRAAAGAQAGPAA